MKRRFEKRRTRRLLRAAIRKTYIHEMGHHLRWWWTVRPDSFGEPERGEWGRMYPDRFDSYFGRLWRYVPPDAPDLELAR